MGDRHFQLTSLCADLHQARLPQCLKSSSVWRKEHKSCDVNDDPWLCVNLSRTAVIFVRRVQQNLSAGGAFLQLGRFRLIVADAVDELGVECHRRAIPDPLLVPGQAQWVRNPGRAGARGYCWNRKPQIMTVFYIRNLKGCEASTAAKWKLVGLTLQTGVGSMRWPSIRPRQSHSASFVKSLVKSFPWPRPRLVVQAEDGSFFACMAVIAASDG